MPKAVGRSNASHTTTTAARAHKGNEDLHLILIGDVIIVMFAAAAKATAEAACMFPWKLLLHAIARRHAHCCGDDDDGCRCCCECSSCATRNKDSCLRRRERRRFDYYERDYSTIFACYTHAKCRSFLSQLLLALHVLCTCV